jgi:hypothetical protein
MKSSTASVLPDWCKDRHRRPSLESTQSRKEKLKRIPVFPLEPAYAFPSMEKLD